MSHEAGETWSHVRRADTVTSVSLTDGRRVDSVHSARLIKLPCQGLNMNGDVPVPQVHSIKGQVGQRCIGNLVGYDRFFRM